MKRLFCVLLCFFLLPTAVFAANGEHWASKELTAAVQAGVLYGNGAGDLEPNRFVTRAELVTMVLRVKREQPQAGQTVFFDVTEDAWYSGAVSYAAAKGYVTGTDDGRFLPDMPVTRQDAAVLLCRMFSINITAGMELSEFADSMLIADYALGSVAALAADNIIGGYDDDTVRPLESLTRAETVVLLSRIQSRQTEREQVSFLRGYPRSASSSLANGFHIIFRTNRPCTIYYTITDATRAGASVVPSPEELTTPLITITEADKETSCFIAADNNTTYNLFFAAKTEDSSSRTAWISRVRTHTYAEGDGSKQNPYRITNEQQLFDVRYQRDKCYLLENDIILSKQWEPLCDGAAAFVGTFDGGGHTIGALTVHESRENVGLFSHIGTNGVVKNLYVDADTVTGSGNVGIIAGQNDGIIEACQTTGAASAGSNTVGGIVGVNYGIVRGCMSAARSIEAYMYAGGIAGYNGGVIDECAAYVHTVSANAYACGIAAVNTKGTVRHCLAGELKLITNIIHNSSRVTVSREGGVAEDNYAYDKMYSLSDDGYQNSNARNGADISFAELTDMRFCREKLGWDTSRWSQSSERAFVAPRITALPEPRIEAGTTLYVPKRISDAAELAAIDTERDAHYMLTADITLTEDWKPIAGEGGLLQDNEEGFSGTLNGNHHSISGLKIARKRQMNGLFGMITGGTVFALAIRGASVEAGNYGGLIAAVNYGFVEDCTVDGHISAAVPNGSAFLGGVVGANYGHITDCDASVYINTSGTDVAAGGIAGYQENYIDNCAYRGQINMMGSKQNASVMAGGIAGYIADGFVYNTYADAAIRMDAPAAYAGGSAGMLDSGELYKASAKGTIYVVDQSETAYAGGLCGLVNNGLVMNSFSVSEMNVHSAYAYAGGLVGYNVSASIQDNYAANKIAVGQGLAGGICGTNENGFVSANAAINPSVEGSGKCARICPQSLQETMYNNYAYSGMKIDGISANETTDGISVAYERLADTRFFFRPIGEGGALGWSCAETDGTDAVWTRHSAVNTAYPFPLLNGVKGQENFRKYRY